MAKKKNDPIWIEAKKKCRLNVATVQMAKELGLNPKSLIKNIPNKNQRWKAPVHIWVQDMYEDRFGEDKMKALLKQLAGSHSSPKKVTEPSEEVEAFMNYSYMDEEDEVKDFTQKKSKSQRSQIKASKPKQKPGSSVNDFDWDDDDLPF